MILNVSGRTDIINYYTPWFLKRLEEGFIDVRNPFYNKMVSRIYLKDVDAFVFCTKNPMPIIPYLSQIKKPIIFQVTITPYKEDIEVNVKDKKAIINSLDQIKDIVGIENLYVRYDPIFLNHKYTLEYHVKVFERLCFLLKGKCKHVIISFLDNYQNVQKNITYLNIQNFDRESLEKLGKEFGKIAGQNNITIQTCCENVDFTKYGFIKNDCVSREYMFKLTGKKFSKWKERNCNCATMVDIGAYNTCLNFCKYCYANYDESKVKINIKNHDINSSLLIGHLQKDDIIKVRNK